jgi:hypothetical protein
MEVLTCCDRLISAMSRCTGRYGVTGGWKAGWLASCCLWKKKERKWGGQKQEARAEGG